MPAKQRSLPRQFTPIAATQQLDLLVSGCSYTWNNSETESVTWPYYLRDLAGFDRVVDCSQPGSGYNHTHTAVVTELETNTELTPESTLVVIMWSGNERVDITADRDLVESCTDLEIPDLGAGLSSLNLTSVTSLNLFNRPSDWRNRHQRERNADVAHLRDRYGRLISTRAQVLESAVRLISLAGYLDSRGFDYVFLDWDDSRHSILIPQLDPWAQGRFADIETLGSWASRRQQRIPNDGHPSPDAHLSWTQEVLIPYLINNNYLQLIST
jgi:hypothetical protein